MGRQEGIDVFISYAHTDGAVLAQRLCQDLNSDEAFDAWLDTKRITAGAAWTTEIERQIDSRPVMLALLTTGSYRSDICRAEQLRALRKGKRVIPLLAQRGSDIPLHLESKHHLDFTGVTPYRTALRTLVADMRAGKGHVLLKEEFRQTYVTAPPLPRNYVERPEALASLRSRLLSDGSGSSIALTALKGMGGIGKTVLAQALCHDEVVRQAFPDGVAWVTAGRESTYDLVTRMREVRRALKDEPGTGETELECINRYRTTMREKAALVVVDDVWNSRDVEPFRAESPRSHILFTTRDASIAASLGADEHVADLLTEEESREVLVRWSGSDILTPEAGDLIRECGRLPLALSMIGAMLRGKPREYWKHVLNLLRSADLARIKAAFPDYPHRDLLRVIQVSVDALDEEARARYFALAVLLEDMAVHPAIQQALWNTSEPEALETAEQFVRLSLAQRDGANCAIRLHDLQLDYIRAHYPDREALDLIHRAARLSAHVVEKDPWQFASQVTGRLLPHQAISEVERFTRSLIVAAPRPWLRPLHPALHPPGTGLLRTLKGHTSYVNGVAVSPDGQRAVSASSDNTLKMWDLGTGRELRTLEGHLSAVRGVAVSPDGRRAVSASHDQTLKLWNLETGRELFTMKGHSHFVTGVVMIADARRAVSSSRDNTLKVWDLETGRELRTLRGHSGGVYGVAVSGDGRRAVSGSYDKTLKMWDPETSHELRTLEGHLRTVRGVAVSVDGRRAVSASDDNTLKVWDLETGRELHALQGHSGGVYGVAVSADGRRAFSASDDDTVKVWDLESGRELRTLEGHSGLVSGVAVSADGRRAVSSSWDKTLKVWDLEMGRELRRLEGHSSPVLGVAVSPDRAAAVSASCDETLKVWDLETGSALRVLEGHTSYVNGVALSPDGRRVVSASADKTLKVWDLEIGSNLRTLQGHTGYVNGVALSPDGRRVVSASADKTLKVWDLETGSTLRTLQGHSSYVNGVALSPDGRRVVSASADKTLKVWDLETGSVLRSLEGHSREVTGVAVSPDGRRAVSASADKTLKVWDLETGCALRTLEGHSDYLTGVAVSPDGGRAVSTSWDHTLTLWDLETGGAIAAFTCDGPARCCVFATPSLIVAGDERGRVHFLLEVSDTCQRST